MKSLLFLSALIIIGANNVSVSAQRARAAKTVCQMSRAGSRAQIIRTAVGSTAANAVLRASRQSSTVASPSQYQNVMAMIPHRMLPAIDTTKYERDTYALELAQARLLAYLSDAQAGPSDPLSRFYDEVRRVAGNSRVEMSPDHVSVSMPGSLNAHSVLFFTHITSDDGVKILLSLIEEITKSRLRHGDLYFVFSKSNVGNGLSCFPDVIFNVNGVEAVHCRADGGLVERAAATIGMTIKPTAVGDIGAQAVQISLEEIEEARKLCFAIVSEVVHRRPEW